MARGITSPSALVSLGVLGGAAVLYEAAWPLVFISLAPVYALAYRSDLSARQRFFLGYGYGISLLGTTLAWVWRAYPLDWAGIPDGPVALLSVGGVWLAVSMFLAAFVGLWAVTARLVARGTLFDILALPASWTLFEYLRAWGFTFFSWGPGSVLEPYFSFGFLGYALAGDMSFLHLARFGGVYTLSFFVALVSCILYAALVRTLIISRAYAGILCTTCVLIVSLLPPYAPPVPALSVATMRTDIPSRLIYSDVDRRERLRQVNERLRTIATDSPGIDVILIPEGVRFLDTFKTYGKDSRAYLTSIFGGRDVLIVDTRRVEEEGIVREEVVFYSTLAGEVAVRKKRILTPVGEYSPYFWELAMRLLGMGSEVEKIEHFRAYLPGENDAPVEWRGVLLPTLLCSEIMAPYGYHTLSRGEKDAVLLNLSSQYLFHGGRNPHAQLAAMARVHAAWSGASFFQSTNGGDAVRFGQ